MVRTQGAGFELGVRTWQGWVAVALFILLMIGPKFVDFQAFGLPQWIGAAIRACTLIIFIPVFWKTYQND